VESNDWRLRSRLRGAAVALGAGPREDGFALFLQLAELWIRIGRHKPGVNSLRDRAHAWIREQDLLECGEIVEELWRRRGLDLCMIDQRAERLLLKRGHPGVELISTGAVWAAGPRVETVRSGELHIINGRNRAPDVDERFARWCVGDGINQFDVRRQRECDPDETVLAEIAEIAGVVAVGPEIVGIDRPKERVVCLRLELSTPLEGLESRLGTPGRELKTVSWHVAVGACPSVAAHTVQASIHEGAEPARNRVARLRAAIKRASRLDAYLPVPR
jgi:hypothetical protein